MAADGNDKSDSPDAGPMRKLAPLAIVTLIGAGGGGVLGASILPGLFEQRPFREEAGREDDAKATAGKTHGDAHGVAARDAAAAAPRLDVRELPPIVANISGDSRRLIRLQAAIVFDPQKLQNAEALLASLRADVAAFLGTLELPSIEGADGLRRLQEELSERAATRSQGRIQEFIIEALVVQ